MLHRQGSEAGALLRAKPSPSAREFQRSFWPDTSVVIGILEVRLVLRQSRSLKDKRRVVSSLKDRLRGKFNVSVAEVDGRDLRQSAVLAVVQVSPDSRYVSGTLQQALSVVRGCPDAQLADHSVELLRP